MGDTCRASSHCGTLSQPDAKTSRFTLTLAWCTADPPLPHAHSHTTRPLFPPGVYRNATASNSTLQEHFVSGTMCDLTGVPRTVNVSYICQQGVLPNIVSVEEPSTCNYNVVVGAAALCPTVNKTSSDVFCWPVDANGSPVGTGEAGLGKQSQGAAGRGTDATGGDDGGAAASRPTAVVAHLGRNQGWDGHVRHRLLAPSPHIASPRHL